MLFTIKELTVKHRTKTLLHIEQLTIHQGKFTAIIGANGAGKSTLLHSLLGKSTGLTVLGRILCQNKPIAEQVTQGKIAWVGQHERFALPLTVLDYALLGVQPSLAWYQKPNPKHIKTAKQLLWEFDLTALIDKRIDSLSGGEKQRLAIVRALMQQTQILLFDEPTNHLDIRHERALFAYLKKMVETQGKSIVVVLHNLTTAYRHADEIIAMTKNENNIGTVIAQGTPSDVMTTSRLSQMYQAPIHIADTDQGKVFL